MLAGVGVTGAAILFLAVQFAAPPSATAAPGTTTTTAAASSPPCVPLVDPTNPIPEAGVLRSEDYPATGLLGAAIIGPGTANPYYEFGYPSGTYTGKLPVGVMVLIHGGGWYTVGRGATLNERPDADRWRARGWATLNIDYPPCQQSIFGVYSFYQRLRQRVGTSTVVCAEGQSAGGQLALMLAVLTNPNCVITEGGFPDFDTLAAENAYPNSDPKLTALQAYNMAQNVFPAPGLLHAVSATTNANYIHAPLLLATSSTDVLVPTQQAADLANLIDSLQTHPQVIIDTLAGGTLTFVHGTASQLALDGFYRQELNLVAPLLPTSP